MWEKCVLFVKTFHGHHNYKPCNLKKNDHSTWFQSRIIRKKQTNNHRQKIILQNFIVFYSFRFNILLNKHMSKIPHYMVELKKRNMENSTFLCKFICVQPITRLFCTILQAMYDFPVFLPFFFNSLYLSQPFS